MAQYFCKRSRSRFRLTGYWSCISVFSSKIIRHIMYMIKTYIIKIQSQNLTHDHRLFKKLPFKWSWKTKSKMIPVQAQIFWAWTGIGIVCRNIGPLSTKSLATVGHSSHYPYLLFYLTLLWFWHCGLPRFHTFKKGHFSFLIALQGKKNELNEMWGS